MPGYTGLEICKRLRASAATAALPVILTVGKLEPYRPEDGEQVQSNAVIVKPFAAAELISAVRSLIGGPSAEAAAHPGLQGGSQSDPLQESPLADPTAPPQPPPLEEPDEPFFASAAGDASAWTPEAPSIYSAGSPPLFGAASNAPASLAFDPDAKATPFSASAFEPLSSPAHSAAEGSVSASIESAFTEFDLAPEPSPYSAYIASEPEILSHNRDAATEMLAADDGLHVQAAASPVAPAAEDVPTGAEQLSRKKKPEGRHLRRFSIRPSRFL